MSWCHFNLHFLVNVLITFQNCFAWFDISSSTAYFCFGMEIQAQSQKEMDLRIWLACTEYPVTTIPSSTFRMKWNSNYHPARLIQHVSWISLCYCGRKSLQPCSTSGDKSSQKCREWLMLQYNTEGAKSIWQIWTGCKLNRNIIVSVSILISISGAEQQTLITFSRLIDWWLLVFKQRWWDQIWLTGR